MTVRERSEGRGERGDTDPETIEIPGRGAGSPSGFGPPEIGAFEARPRPPFARGPVLTLAAAVAVVLGVCAHWYGYFGDELYFVAAGHHPSWGYADQPPVLPLLAAGLDDVAPGSTVVLRLPAVLATALTVVLAALMARELGGRSRAQLTAAGAVAISEYLVASGRLLATSTLDPFWWALITWLVVRWVRSDRDDRPDDRLLLVAGVVLAVALDTKFLVLGLVAGVAVGVLAVGPRRLLTRPLLWLGLVIAGLATVPTLIWQATHGWPQLQMGAVVGDEAFVFGDRWAFVPMALFFAGVIPGVVLVLVGLWALLRRPSLAPWRFLGVAVLVTTAMFVVAGGRPYYSAGFYALLFAAGAVALQGSASGAAPPLRSVLQERPARAWWRWTTGPVVFVICGVLTAALTLPIGPSSVRDQQDFTTMGQVGWPEQVDAVARTYHQLPPGQVGAVIAGGYWGAGALERRRAEAGLPGVYSPHRGYWYLAVPPGSEPALLVGNFRPGTGFCASLTPLPAYVPARPNPVVQTIPLAVCVPRAPWATLWPSMRSMA